MRVPSTNSAPTMGRGGLHGRAERSGKHRDEHPHDQRRRPLFWPAVRKGGEKAPDPGAGGGLWGPGAFRSSRLSRDAPDIGQNSHHQIDPQLGSSLRDARRCWPDDSQYDANIAPRLRVGHREGRRVQGRALTANPVQWAANAHMSAVWAMILSVGLPAPCPARVSMRMRCGLVPMSAA